MFDKITIHTINPNGWPVDFEITPEPGRLDEALIKLAGWGYSPAPTAEAARGFQYTPEGDPICPKHGEVMRKREKQGDTWHSHGVADDQGNKHYCRGYASKNSPGWSIG